MKNIEIQKIKVKENVRTDYGDLTEMTVSIQKYGLRNPVELNKDNELIDGFRRIKAAQAAGLKEVPYFVNEEELNKATSQIISGIFQKNLNPIEEGNAFKKYMEDEKINVESLSKQISKQKLYIDKRLILVNLPEDVKNALINKKILLGHALILSKLTKKDSSKYLKHIIKKNYSVEDAKSEVSYGGVSKRLEDAYFDKTECKNCQYNGAMQSELFETGKVLNGACLNVGCFRKKIVAAIKELKKKYKDVIFDGKSNWDSPDGYVEKDSWDAKEKGITKSYMNKCRKEKHNYLVKIKDDGKLVEYFKAPAKKKETTEKSEIESTDKSEGQLQVKVENFKQNLLVNKSIELMQPGTIQSKALGLIYMMQRADWNEKENLKSFRHFFGEEFVSEINAKKIFKASEEELDKAISTLAANSFRRMDMKELIESSRNFGVDINKHFELNNEFLQLHTKDQLINLLNELGHTLDKGIVKKSEIIEFILSKNLKGKVPKIIK